MENNKKVTVEVIEHNHDKVVLQNKRGDTFTFNPITANGQYLYDFLLA